jgi:iron complex outermembrane receptor protein
LRRDGSSAFGKNNRWGTFPSASVAWRITEEPFMKNLSFIENLKLRVGYGVSGNSIGFNPLISLLRFGQSGVTLYNGEFLKGIIPTQNENPDLKWEVTKMMNVGLDFSVMKGRLSGTVEYYEKNTDDLLWTYSVSSTEYYVPSFTANVGAMENKGYEVTLNAVPFQKRNFSWNSSLVLSHNKNVLTSLSNDRFQVEYIYVGAVGNHGQSGMNSQILQEGYPVGQFYTWKYAGPDDKGQSQFVKADGTLTTTPLTTDRHYEGNAQPELTGGWHNTITYRNFSLDFLLRGVTGNKIMNVTLSNLNYPGEATHYNQHRMVLESPVIDINAPYTSTRYLEKGDYLRLDNITLMYSFKFSNPLIQGLKLYSTINNAFVITGYRGADPDVNMGGITPGIDDDNYYPKTRSFIFGVNVDF